MLLTRRAALGLAAGLAILPPRAWGQESPEDEFPPLPPRFGADDRPDFRGVRTLGRVTPPPIDFEVADALIDQAPHGCAPVKVALYWRAVGQGTIPDLGSSRLQRRAGRHFARGWPGFYNPVIIDFFKVTSTDPLARQGDGDGTHWCAAFVNWCIARGLARSADRAEMQRTRLQGTRSASSGSFRCWNDPVREGQRPSCGDIVVWATEGTVDKCQFGQGHVAFYLEPDAGETFFVVGGNQRDRETVPGATQSAVTRRSYAPSFNIAPPGARPKYKKLHSIRTVGFLRSDCRE